MAFQAIGSAELQLNPFTAVGKQWMLITSGDEQGFNTMTASWGGFGIMFGKDVAVVVVRPSRYTYQFMEKNERFTMSFFDERYRSALQLCGAKSGRDIDKPKAAGLTPVFLDGTTTFAEASLVLVAKKLYIHDFKPEGFLDADTLEGYGDSKNFHRAYLSEIIKVYKA